MTTQHAILANDSHDKDEEDGNSIHVNEGKNESILGYKPSLHAGIDAYKAVKVESV